MAGERVYGASNIAALLLNNEGQLPRSDASDALFVSTSSSPRFHGSRTMVSFGDVCGSAPDRSFFHSLDHEETGDEDLDECFHQPEKKRRLTADQVQFLERSFEVENKLEPERKIQLARDLGLQPRQVAIWFQNRRARWKTKQLEKDYETLRTSYDSLKDDYDKLLEEKEKLKTQVLVLTDELLLNGKDQEKSETSELKSNLQSQKLDLATTVEVKQQNAPMLVPKQEDLSSANSAVFDSDSPHYTDGVHSSLLEPAGSSNIFEPDHSDISHTEEEEENLSRNLFPPPYLFPKLEDSVYSEPPVNSCNYAFPVEDQTCWYWPY